MSEFKLEEGKKYVDRRGRVYGPLVYNAPYFGDAEEELIWSRNGRVSTYKQYSLDLVAEYVEPQPVESPDDWVTQDRVPARPGIDQRAYAGLWSITANESGWKDVSCMNWPTLPRHGDKVPGSCNMVVHIRCRRKDLPSVEETYPQYRVTFEPENYAFVRINDRKTVTFVRLDGTEEPKVCFPYAWENVNGRDRLTKEEALAKIEKPKPATKKIKVHTVLYGSSVMLAKYILQVPDTRLEGFKQEWKYVQILKTEEFEVPCE